MSLSLFRKSRNQSFVSPYPCIHKVTYDLKSQDLLLVGRHLFFRGGGVGGLFYPGPLGGGAIAACFAANFLLFPAPTQPNTRRGQPRHAGIGMRFQRIS